MSGELREGKGEGGGEETVGSTLDPKEGLRGRCKNKCGVFVCWFVGWRGEGRGGDIFFDQIDVKFYYFRHDVTQKKKKRWKKRKVKKK